MLPKPSEHEIQCNVMEWAQMSEGRYPMLKWFFAIPNGTRTSISIAAKMKKEGVKKGVADLFLPYPMNYYNGLFIEVKRDRSSNKSKEQKDFIFAMRDNGYYATFAHGFDECVQVIEQYLDGLL